MPNPINIEVQRSLLNASFTSAGSRDEIVLAKSFAGSFENRIFNSKISDLRIDLTSSGEITNFPQVLASRNNSENLKSTEQKYLDPQGVTLSNVGVSLIISVTIDNQDYALLQYRKNNNRHMLISGYVDSSLLKDKYQQNDAINLANFEFNRTAGKEGLEELLPFSGQGDLLSVDAIQSRRNTLLNEILFADDKILDVYPESGLTKSGQKAFKIEDSELPAYIKAVNKEQEVYADGQRSDGFFYIDKTSNSGQMIYPFKITFNSLDGLSLMHAETQPDKEADERNGRKGHLKEVLDPDGIVLVKIDRESGLLTDQTFQLRRGLLIPRNFPGENILLSEPFVAPAEDKLPVVLKQNVSFKEYREY